MSLNDRIKDFQQLQKNKMSKGEKLNSNEIRTLFNLIEEYENKLKRDIEREDENKNKRAKENTKTKNIDIYKNKNNKR